MPPRWRRSSLRWDPSLVMDPPSHASYPNTYRKSTPWQRESMKFARTSPVPTIHARRATMCDNTTVLADLRRDVQAFIDQRDWRQFHSPKNLSMSIAIEAAELMEHFQWVESKAGTALSPADQEQVREELADIVCYVL